MTRKWTIDGKVRAASQGPWIAASDLQTFLKFCEANGHKTRVNPDPFRNAHDVFHAGHWMSLIWNKSFKRFTADRWLSLLVQSFAVERSPAV